MKQSVLSFATSTPASKQARTRILAGALPSIADIDHHVDAEILVDDTRTEKKISTV